MTVWPSGLCAGAGLMGAAGVGLAAIAAHRPGSADLGIAAQFLLIHGVAVPGLVAISSTAGTTRSLWLAAASLLVAGTWLFSLDLAMIGLADLRPLPLAAPVGGFGMMAGWFMVAFAAVVSMKRNE